MAAYKDAIIFYLIGEAGRVLIWGKISERFFCIPDILIRIVCVILFLQLTENKSD